MDAANIVDVVSEFVSLRKSGANYKGLCPFHDDRTPSFSVSPARGLYKCFACGKGGNAVSFIMEHEQMSYPDALRWLARKYHIEIKERELTNEEREQESERESLFIVNEWAADYFSQILHEDPDGQAVGLAYFRSRGFRDDIIARFRLGYAPQKRTALVSASKKKGYKEEFLVKSGLCVQRDDGTLYDRFAGRVIFPWIGLSGKVTAFGGRVLDSRTKGVAQKYVNSPDSVVYHKDHELYGLYQAKKAIAKEDCVYMVEGYTDVLSMHQCGIENVVANSGTALSVHQIKLLRRFTTHIVLLYDGDEAGIHAAFRGADMFLQEGMNIKMLLLPDGDDPDSFARKHTAADFRQYVVDHQEDFLIFKTRYLLQGVNDPDKRSEGIASIVKSISVISDQIVRSTYIKECAQRIGIPEKSLIYEMNKFIRNDREEQLRQKKREEEKRAANPQRTPIGPLSGSQLTASMETLLIQQVIRHGAERVFKDLEDENGNLFDLSVAEFIYYNLQEDSLRLETPLYQSILGEAVVLVQKGETNLLEYFERHPDVRVSTLATQLGMDSYILSENNQVRVGEETLRAQVEHVLLDYRLAIVKNRVEQLRQQLALATNKEEKVKIMEEMMQLMAMRKEFARMVGKSIII
jgi:DNA primase